MTYRQQLQDPRWRQRRMEVVRASDGHCKECARTAEDGVILQGHHVTYVRGKMLWEYPDDLLICVCSECHLDRQVHDEEAMFEFARMLSRMSTWEVYELSKGLRQNNDGGLRTKLFDAYAAITEAHHNA